MENKGNSSSSHHPHHSKSHHHPHSQQDQVQAIYLAQANIFSYEARKSAKSWVPLCDSTVPISILFDNTRSIYRIISVDADIKEVVVNTTVIPELEFVKTTQKFGYWKDIASGRVFGIGFASEYEAEAFDECLRKVKQNILSPAVNSASSLSSAESSSNHNAMVSGGGGGGCQSQHHHLQQQTKPQSNPPTTIQRLYPGEDPGSQLKGHGDGLHSNSALAKLPPIPPQSLASPRPAQGGPPPPPASTSGKKQVNWNDFDQLGPAVISFMNNSRQQQHPFIANNPFSTDHRPSTYKVDLPIIEGKSAPGTAPAPPPMTTSPSMYPSPSPHVQQSPNLDDNLRMSSLHQAHSPPPMAPPLPSYHHHMPPPTYSQYYSQNQSQMDTSTNPCSGPPPPLMPLTMSIPHGYCYQGPPSPSLQNPSMIGSPQCSGAGDSNRIMENSLKAAAATTAELFEEINRLKGENIKLSESLIESTCNAKKWELQVSSLREDNIQLVKSVADLNSKVDTVNKECREYKEQASRWKEHYQQAVTSAKEKSQSLKDAEDKLKCCSQDKSRIESVMKDLEEELKRQQQINKEQKETISSNGHQMVGQFSNKYFRELEDHYKKLLTDSQRKIEEVLKKDGDRKNVLRGVDTLFTGAIQGLINIHGQIRQAYEQQQ